MKGTCEIQLINADGSIAQQTRDDNLVTNAIQNLLNPPPLLFAESGGAEYPIYFFNLMSNMEKLLGGVMLWSENIEEDPNIIFPPNIEAQVGYAGNDAYTGSNAFRGSFNTIESGKTHNGYKFVWDFPTSASNGTIKCVTLTSGLGGRCGWGGEPSADIMRSAGLSINATSSQLGSFLGQWQPDVFTFGWASGNNIVLRDVEFPLNSIKAGSAPMFSYRIGRKYTDDPTTTLAVGYAPNSYNWFCDNDKIVICTANYPYRTINYVKIDVLTKEIVDQKEIGTGLISVSISESAVAPYVELDGYLYHLTSEQNHRMILKINLADTTQQEQILLPLLPYNGWRHLFVYHGKLAFRTGHSYESNKLSVYLNTDGEWIPIRTEVLDSSHLLKSNSPALSLKPPFTLYGRTDNAYVQSCIYNAYLATINNLSTPVVKTASQTMKVTYTVTDVEAPKGGE